MTNRIKIILALVMPWLILGFIGVVFNISNPLKIGPLGIMLVFVLLYFFCLSLFCGFLYLGLSLLKYLNLQKDHGKRKLYYVASIVALMPVLLLALHSIGQLKIKEFVLTIILVLTLGFYIYQQS